MCYMRAGLIFLKFYVFCPLFLKIFSKYWFRRFLLGHNFQVFTYFLLFLFYVPCSAKGQRHGIRGIILQFVHQICFWKKCDQLQNVFSEWGQQVWSNGTFAAVVLQMRILEEKIWDSKWYLAGGAGLWRWLREEMFMCKMSVPYTEAVQDGFRTSRYSWW